MKNNNPKPFVKWVGGKRGIKNKIIPLLPKEYNEYYEPFIGGGAIFMHLQPEKSTINDINNNLISTYQAIKQDPYRLREYLLLMEMGHNVIITKDDDNVKKLSPFYNKIRAIDKRTSFDDHNLNTQDSIYLLGSRFIYLNKNTFNGLYRVNKSGEFNSPSKHATNQKTFDFNNLIKVSKTLKNTTIYNKDYKEIFKLTKHNDFVYIDPPYDYEEGTKGFTSYQKESFNRDSQIELSKECKKLNDKGVKFMLSNHNTKLIQDLYKDYEITVIKANRNIGGKGASRDAVEEVIIRNYKD